MPPSELVYLDWYDGLIFGCFEQPEGALFVLFLSQLDDPNTRLYLGYFIESATLNSLDSWRIVCNRKHNGAENMGSR